MSDKTISSLTLYGMEIRFANKSSNQDLKFSVDSGLGYLVITIEDKLILPLLTKDSKGGYYLNPKAKINFPGEAKKKRGRPRKTPV